MDISTAFGYPFSDEDWIKKLGIGSVFALLSLVLIGIPFILGYMADTIRNVIRGEANPLPDWSNLGEMFVAGLALTVVAILYLLPVILLSCLMGLVSLAAGNGDGDALLGTAISCITCLSSIWGLLVAAVFPAALIRYAESREFSSAFRFGEIFSLISSNVGNYVVAVLIGWLVSCAAAFGVVICCIGVFFTTFWGYLVMAHLWGQVGRRASSAAT
jgi:hypothetical protein